MCNYTLNYNPIEIEQKKEDELLLPLIELIFAGKEAASLYKELPSNENANYHLMLLIKMCSRFRDELDGSSPNDPPISISYVGKFFQSILPDENIGNIIKFIRTWITFEKLKKFEIEEHPDWQFPKRKLRLNTSTY